MKLTKFQKRILSDLEKAPNNLANWYEVAWNEFPETWAKRRSRGILIVNIHKAAKKLEAMGLISISPPRHQYDAAVYHLKY